MAGARVAFTVFLVLSLFYVHGYREYTFGDLWGGNIRVPAFPFGSVELTANITVYSGEVVELRLYCSDEIIVTYSSSLYKCLFSNTSASVSKNNNGVLFGVARGRLSEGIEYRVSNKTILKLVIIAGLPFPKITRVYQRKISYFIQKSRVPEERMRDLLIFAPAVRTIIQVCGRLIRSEEDKGVCIIFDRRFLQKSFLSKFPEPWNTPQIRDDLEGILRDAIRHVLPYEQP